MTVRARCVHQGCKAIARPNGAPNRPVPGSNPDVKLVLSCEHACAKVPPEHAPALAIPAGTLSSHRGWDPGAAGVTRTLARAFGAPAILGRVTRLAVDLNRSASNPRAVSSFARSLGPIERAALVRRYHAPHWAAVREAVAAAGRGTVLHLSVHSFTPKLGGAVRTMDIGLLYDPGRVSERATALRWQAALRQRGLRVARNAPYRGISDGITRGMRRHFDEQTYVGIELELNQALLVGGRFGCDVVDALEETLAPILASSSAPLLESEGSKTPPAGR